MAVTSVRMCRIEAAYRIASRRIESAHPSASIRAFGWEDAQYPVSEDPTRVGGDGAPFLTLEGAWIHGLRKWAGEVRSGKRPGGIPVFDGAHNHPIWTDEENLRFRAHHDAMHVIGDHDFSLAGETATWAATCVDLGAHNVLSQVARVLYVEIVMQRAHYERTGSFPVDEHGKQPLSDLWDDVVAKCILADFSSPALDPYRHLLLAV